MGIFHFHFTFASKTNLLFFQFSSHSLYLYSECTDNLQDPLLPLETTPLLLTLVRLPPLAKTPEDSVALVMLLVPSLLTLLPLVPFTILAILPLLHKTLEDSVVLVMLLDLPLHIPPQLDLSMILECLHLSLDSATKFIVQL